MYLSDYYCINAPMLLAHDVYGNQQALLYQIRMVLLIFHKLHLVLALMKAFQQWGYFFNAKPLTNQGKKLPNSLSKIPILDHFCGNQNYAR